MFNKKTAVHLIAVVLIFSGFLSSVQTAAAQSVSLTDLRNVAINAVVNYFSDPASAKLTLAELKDLLAAYASAAGALVDLSGIGQNSGQKLIDIYNKAKGDAADNPSPPPSGSLGTKTNPIKLDQLCVNCAAGGYTHVTDSLSPGSFALPANAKAYFEVDPKGYSGQSFTKIRTRVTIKESSQKLNFYYSVASRLTGQEIKSETKISQDYFLAHTILDSQPDELDNVKFIYAIENKNKDESLINVWWAGSGISGGIPSPSPSPSPSPPASLPSGPYNGTITIPAENTGDYSILDNVWINEGRTLKYLVKLNQSLNSIKAMFVSYGHAADGAGDIAVKIYFPQAIDILVTSKQGGSDQPVGLQTSVYGDNSGGESDQVYVKCPSSATNCFTVGNYVIEVIPKTVSGAYAGQFSVYTYPAY